MAGTHYAASLNTASPGVVYLTIDGSSGANLEWTSTGDPNWDTVTANWLNFQTAQSSLFLAGDNVMLDDPSGVPLAITIPAGVTVYPGIITNNSVFNFYSISGSGHIGGNASIVKMGTSTLTLSTANSFTGPVEVQNGMLQIGSDTALGSTAADTVVDDGGTLDLNGHNLGGEALTVAGAGYAGQGAVVNYGGSQFQAVRQITMTGDTTFGGSALWSINNGGGTASLSTGGNPYSLTKVGPNQVSLAQLTTVDGALADINIQQGILEFSGLTSSMGDPSRTLTVAYGATLSFANGSVSWTKNFALTGDGADNTVNVATGGNTELAGPVSLSGPCIFNVTGTALAVSGVISGDGGLTKNGGSPMILETANAYTGDTVINTGALRLYGGGAIDTTPNITIAAGASLGVFERFDSALTLTTGQTLKGYGTVNGALVAGAGSTLSPGVDATGTLTVTNAASLAGTATMDIDAGNATNDVLTCGGAITYGGVLNLVYVNGSPATGSSYKLFQAPGYSGAFSSISPATPGPGQAWDTSALTTSGKIKVVASSGSSSPHFGGVTYSGGNLVVSGSGGAAAGTYYIIATTNIGTPSSSWIPIATNTYDGSGNFSFTNVVNPALPQRFFQLKNQ